MDLLPTVVEYQIYSTFLRDCQIPGDTLLSLTFIPSVVWKRKPAIEEVPARVHCTSGRQAWSASRFPIPAASVPPESQPILLRTRQIRLRLL